MRTLSELYQVLYSELSKPRPKTQFICLLIEFYIPATGEEREVLLKDFLSRKEEIKNLGLPGWHGGDAWFYGGQNSSRLKTIEYLMNIHKNTIGK